VHFPALHSNSGVSHAASLLQGSPGKALQKPTMHVSAGMHRRATPSQASPPVAPWTLGDTVADGVLAGVAVAVAVAVLVPVLIPLPSLGPGSGDTSGCGPELASGVTLACS
jgi:hypothetical protein